MNLTNTNQVDPDVLGLLRDPNAPYRVWDSTQIYTGGVSTKGLHVPNVGDKVDHWIGNTLYEKRVVAVDESTLIPTLEDIQRPQSHESELNQFVGVGPGYSNETWRVYYDPNVVPHTLVIDTAFKIYGTEASHIKVFKGRDIGPTGKVISQYRSATSISQYSENVPLYQFTDRFDGSAAEKRPVIFYTTEDLAVGEEVTAVVYTDGGQASSTRVFRVVHGSNIMSFDHEQTYVAGIELISPFLSETDDRLLEFPSNMPLDGVFTRAKVLYTNGEERVLTIDGGRMKLIGLEYYVPTKRNETNSLVLRYQLAKNEHAWNTNVGESRHITETYRYRTVAVDGSYSVMLNVIPVYDANRRIWDLRYWLYNLDRDLSLDVTQHIEMGANSEIFDGKRFGVTQHLTVALQLDQLDIGLNQFRYVQQIDIGLAGAADSSDRPYIIHYHNDQKLAYGEYNQLKFKPTIHENQKYLNFNEIIQADTVDKWLEYTYYAAQPLFDERIEDRAPKPTHFILRNLDGSFEKEFDLSKWNQDILVELPPNVTLRNGDTMFVEFIRKQGRTTQYLNMTSWNLKP